MTELVLDCVNHLYGLDNGQGPLGSFEESAMRPDYFRDFLPWSPVQQVGLMIDGMPQPETVTTSSASPVGELVFVQVQPAPVTETLPQPEPVPAPIPDTIPDQATTNSVPPETVAPLTTS